MTTIKPAYREIPLNVRSLLTLCREPIFIVALLVVLTITVLIVHRFGPQRDFFVDVASGYKTSAGDDRTSGGNSKARVKDDQSAMKLLCNIKEGYAYPYCQYNINISDSNLTGIDLSKYQQVGLKIYYKNQEDLPVRMQLRNFDASYSEYNEPQTYKFNTVPFYANANQKIWLPLNHFQVAGWWITDYNIPLEQHLPDFSNIFSIEFATGDHLSPGKYELYIEQIHFRGQYITNAQLYFIILAVWLFLAITYLLSHIVTLGNRLKETQIREAQLVSINQLLNVKSQNLAHKASTDELTGVYNRSALKDIFYDSVDEDHNLSVIFMDIDYFKKINDNYSHEVGDQVLQQFGALISKNTRNNDILARWGGEEFILACPDTNIVQAGKIAEELRKKVQLHQWPESMEITCSFGVAQKNNETHSQLIHRADQALYEAKRAGRNCVSINSTSIAA